MKILPIYLNSYYPQVITPYNTNTNSNRTVLPVQKPDTVSFSGSAPNAEPLRALLPYRIPDLYSPIILLDPAKINDIINKHVFSRGLKGITNVIEPMIESLFPIEEDFYTLIRAHAFRHPNKQIGQLVQELVPKHEKLLMDLQIPIFEDIRSYSIDFPADLLERFDYLMYINDRKIHNKPVFVPFSVKEFKYKLNNIKKRIMSSASDEEINAMNRLISIAGSVQNVPKEQRLSPNFKLTKYEDKQKQMISKMLEYFERSVLKDDKELRELLENSERRIYKVPINIRFNRKSFIYDLQEILELLEDRKLARIVEQKAISLPTSKQNLSAFIMKASARSDDQIALDMLSGSEGNIDHIKAQIKGGADNINNYLLSSSYKNSLKAHKSFRQCYREDPNIAEYAQAQIDRLIKLARKGVFKRVHLGKSYIPHLAHKLEKLSKDPSLKFDLYGL